MIGGFGSLAVGILTTNLSSHSVKELDGADMGETEGCECSEESVLVSGLSDDIAGVELLKFRCVRWFTLIGRFL